MAKVTKEPMVALFPMPTTMVSCAGKDGRPNIITIAWAGTMCSDPPHIGIGVRPQRYSHDLIAETGEFVVNIPSQDLLWEADFCGTVSGREVDKFAAAKLTPLPSSQLKFAPLIAECPVNIECQVVETLHLGVHDLFLGKVVAVHFDEKILDEAGRPDYEKLKAFGFINRGYLGAGGWLAARGFAGREGRR